MTVTFTTAEQSALDLLRNQSLVAIKQRIDHLSRTALFEELTPSEAQELLTAKLAYDITSPTGDELAKAAHEAILARRQASWQQARNMH